MSRFICPSLPLSFFHLRRFVPSLACVRNIGLEETSRASVEPATWRSHEDWRTGPISDDDQPSDGPEVPQSHGNSEDEA